VVIYRVCYRCYPNCRVTICKGLPRGCLSPPWLTVRLFEFRPSPCLIDVNLVPVVTTIRDLHLAHWPEVVRKMAVHLKGLAEGVLRKKAETLGERHERAEADDGDLTP